MNKFNPKTYCFEECSLHETGKDDCIAYQMMETAKDGKEFWATRKEWCVMSPYLQNDSEINEECYTYSESLAQKNGFTKEELKQADEKLDASCKCNTKQLLQQENEQLNKYYEQSERNNENMREIIDEQQEELEIYKQKNAELTNRLQESEQLDYINQEVELDKLVKQGKFKKQDDGSYMPVKNIDWDGMR